MAVDTSGYPDQPKVSKKNNIADYPDQPNSRVDLSGYPDQPSMTKRFVKAAPGATAAVAGTLGQGLATIAEYPFRLAYDVSDAYAKGDATPWRTGVNKASDQSVEEMELPMKYWAKTEDEKAGAEFVNNAIMYIPTKAGRGLGSIAELLATGDLQSASDVAEGKSQGTSVFTPIANVTGQTAGGYAMGAPIVKAIASKVAAPVRAIADRNASKVAMEAMEKAEALPARTPQEVVIKTEAIKAANATMEKATGESTPSVTAPVVEPPRQETPTVIDAPESQKVSETVSSKQEISETPSQAKVVSETPTVDIPSESPTQVPTEGVTTGIKKSIVNGERVKRGLDEAEVTLKSKYGPDLIDEVKNDIASGAIHRRTLAQTFIENPRPASAKEVATLEMWRADLNRGLRNVYKDIESAIQNRDVEKEGQLRTIQKALEDDLDLSDRSARQISYEWGQAGQKMQWEVFEDYSLASMLQRAKVDRGVKELPPDVRAKYEKLAQDIEEANAKIEALEEHNSTLQSQISQKKLNREIALERRKTKRVYAKKELDVEFDSLANEFHQIFGGTQLHAGIDPTAVVVLGKMAKNRVQAGIVKAMDVADSVYNALIEKGANITLREVRDAISGYGVTSKMSQEAINIQLREVKRQLRLTSALEDAKSGKTPEYSGLRRDPQSDTVRDMTRQVHQAMKEAGIDSKKARSPEEQWRTALDSIKTRLRNQIYDLEKQLKTGEKSPKKVGVEYDTEAKALKEVRDKLKATLEQVEGKRQMSPEQKTQNAISAVERSIAEYERKIEQNDILPMKQPSTTPVTPELARLREVRDGLRVVLDQMRKDARPQKSPEEVALQQYRTRLASQINQYEKKLAEGNFEAKPKRDIPNDKVSNDLRFKLETAKKAYHKARFKDQLERRDAVQVWIDSIKETINTPRTIITSFDVSAPFRQGAFIFLSHPIRGAKTIPDMFRALVSEKNQFKIEQQIVCRKNYPLYERAGLYLAEHGKNLSKMEEVYQNRWLMKRLEVMGVDVNPVAASQRAYTTFLNKLRADSFDAMLENLTKSGKATTEEMKAIANYVNVTTGRGEFKGADVASLIFFAPRYTISRFQTVIGQPIYKAGRVSPRVRKLVEKEYAKALTGIGVVLSLGYFAGAEIELDPRSSDFAKIKFGNTRLDPMAGLSQASVFLARIASGTTKTGKGRIEALVDDTWAAPGKKASGRSTIGPIMEVVARFLRTKLSPWLGTSIDVKMRRDVVGNPVSIYDVPQKLVVPLSFGDIATAMDEQGVAFGSTLSLLALLGMGMNTYGPGVDKPRFVPWGE